MHAQKHGLWAPRWVNGEMRLAEAGHQEGVGLVEVVVVHPVQHQLVKPMSGRELSPPALARACVYRWGIGAAAQATAQYTAKPKARRR